MTPKVQKIHQISTMVRPLTVKSEHKSDTESSGTRSAEPMLADNFPSKAYLVIEHCDANDPGVACWSDDGSFFVVKDTPTFASSHLPRYFKHSNFQSFVRQLNIYGFRTVKEYDSSDGSVAFHHTSFQRSRRDLLGDIKRAKKTSKKQRTSFQEEKRDDFEALNARFDDMQQQMDTMSEKLDLLISLVTAYPNALANNNVHVGEKRRRMDDRGSPVSDITDPTAVSTDRSSSSDSESSQVAAPVALPRFNLDMDVVDEEEEAFENDHNARARYGDLMELQESTREMDDDSDHHAASFKRAAVAAVAPSQHDDDEEEEENLEEEDTDFKMYIDKMLDGAEGGDDDEDQQQGYDHRVTDNLRSKVDPDAVHGATFVPQTTASVVVVHSNEEYDEETGEYNTATPLTTAVEVTDDAPDDRRKSRRRLKLFIAVAVLMVLAAFIIWPVVAFRKPPPPRRVDRPAGVGGGNGGGSGSGRRGRHSSSSGSSSDESFEDIVEDESQFDRLGDSGRHNDGPRAKAISQESLTLGLDGETYQCVLAIRPP